MSNVTTIWRGSENKRDIARRLELIRSEEKSRAEAEADQRRKARAAKAHGKQIEAERQAAWAAHQLDFNLSDMNHNERKSA